MDCLFISSHCQPTNITIGKSLSVLKLANHMQLIPTLSSRVSRMKLMTQPRVCTQIEKKIYLTDKTVRLIGTHQLLRLTPNLLMKHSGTLSNLSRKHMVQDLLQHQLRVKRYTSYSRRRNTSRGKRLHRINCQPQTHLKRRISEIQDYCLFQEELTVSISELE